MKLNIRLISLLLSLIMILGIFASCDSDPADTTESDQTSDTVENGDVTEAPSAGERTAFELIVNGEATVRVVRPEALNSDAPAVTAAVKIRNKLEDTTGVKLTMGDDFKKATESYDETSIEILVGNTRYPQTAEAIKDLKYGDFTVKAVGNKIVIFGFTADAIDHAANQFIKIVKEYYDTANSANLTVPAEALNISGTHSGSKQLSILPVIDGASFYSTYASNIDCEEIILDDVTADSYNAYITKLESEGYTKYTSNDINGNLFTTLYNKDYTLNVGYYKPYDQCRIIMEPYYPETLPGLESENQYKVVTTSQVTMIGCEYKKTDGYAGNGLCLLFRLADGRFVIVDGSFNRADNATTLANIIKEQAKEYASGKDIKIAAWFISHAHSDHDGVLKGHYSAFKQFTVERVIANFMTDEERQRSINSSYSGNWSSTEGGSDDDDRAAAAALGADFIVCHVGQRFYFADTVFEILYTVESYGPTVVNALNTSTILVRAITTDANGKSSTTMIMGDCTGPAMAICNKMYGTNMRSEIVQVAHHGYTTWGNDTAMATAYKYMAPEIVLWPQGNNAFPTYKEKSYNKVLWDGTNKNFQQMYVAGWIGSQYIVPLPYSGSTDSVISLPKTGK